MKEVFVVVASQGEYSDRDEWPERAFASDLDAQRFCDGISAAAREFSVECEGFQKKFREAKDAVGLPRWPRFPLSDEHQRLWQAAERVAGPHPSFDYKGATRAADHYTVCAVPFFLAGADEGREETK
ncbi:MAG: hypothetical protein ACRCYS_04970 [Beijerinckiaceae bacterium]